MSVNIMVDGVVVSVPDDDPRVPKPAPLAPVTRVSALAAKIALDRASLLDKVRSAIASAGGEAQIWFDDADHWERQNAYVLQFAATLTLTDAQVDALFAAAAAIDASLT